MPVFSSMKHIWGWGYDSERFIDFVSARDYMFKDQFSSYYFN
jgi:hypothetical protein